MSLQLGGISRLAHSVLGSCEIAWVKGQRSGPTVSHGDLLAGASCCDGVGPEAL